MFVFRKVSLLKLKSSSLYNYKPAFTFHFEIKNPCLDDSSKENAFNVSLSWDGGPAFFRSSHYFLSNFTTLVHRGVSQDGKLLNITVSICGRRKSLDASTVCKRIIQNNINMLNDQIYSDFTFIVDQKQFKVHKNILAVTSPVFFNLFNSNMQESLKNECHVGNINSSIFGHMLNFIYGAVLPPDIKDISINLYAAAHYYEIKDLMDICKTEIRSNLSIANALEVYICATLYDMEDLQKDAMKMGNIGKHLVKQSKLSQ